MAKYNVSIYRTVQDRLRAMVEVEAENQAEAIAKAKQHVEADEVEFAWHQCGDTIGDDEYDPERQP